jgi:hypothetical protein
MSLMLSELSPQTAMAPGTVTPVAPSCINIPVMEGCHAEGYLSTVRSKYAAGLT